MYAAYAKADDRRPRERRAEDARVVAVDDPRDRFGNPRPRQARLQLRVKQDDAEVAGGDDFVALAHARQGLWAPASAQWSAAVVGDSLGA